MRIRSKWLYYSLVLAALLTAHDVWAARPAETLLPANTVGLLAFPSTKGLEQRFGQTHYQALLDDPRLADLAGDFRQTTGDFRKEVSDRLGLDWNAMAACTTGELVLAVVVPDKGKSALVLIADVTGKEAQAHAELAAQSQKLPAGMAATGKVREGLLLAAESAEAMQTLLNGWDRKAEKQLAQAVAYQTVMKRSQSLMAPREAQIRFYFVPLPWAEATAPPKAAAPDPNDSKLADAVVMRRQGLAGVQGVGGLLAFPGGEYDSFVTLAIYAPPPLEKAVQLLNFPGAAAVEAAAWVPKDVGSHLTVSWDLKDFWRYYGPLYDDTNADGIAGAFNDMLDGLRDDPDGPQIDVRKAFFPKLSDQITVVTGPPDAGNSDRPSTLYVIATTGDLAPLLQRYWEGDPDVRKQDWHGRVIWEIVAAKGAQNPLNFISAAAFSDNRLFLSTDANLLKSALAPHAENETLAGAPEFREAQKRLSALQPGQPFLRLFSWPEFAVRDMQRLLRSATSTTEPKPSGSAPAVPAATAERQHLGPMAVRMDRVENGWTLSGFMLPAPPR